MDADIHKIVAVLNIVSTWRSWTKKNRVGKQERIECPLCKGGLLLTQSPSNGHIQGQCATAGCVSFIE